MNVGFIGIGTMGSMLIKAFVGSGALAPEQVFASNRSAEKVERLVAAHPGLHAVDNASLAQQCRTVFLCVKARETIQVLKDIAPYITSNHLCVAITNSIDIQQFEQAVSARVAKVIPSVANSVCGGVSLLMFGQRVLDADKEILYRLFSSISSPVAIAEDQARVASDLTSCGPAFLAYVYKAMAEAAHHFCPGLPLPNLEAMVHQTAIATARLLADNNLSFDDIIGRVATPGGITAEGIKVLQERLGPVWEAVIETTIVKEEGKKVKFVD